MGFCFTESPGTIDLLLYKGSFHKASLVLGSVLRNRPWDEDLHVSDLLKKCISLLSCCWDQIPNKYHVLSRKCKERKIYFCSWFQGIEFRVSWVGSSWWEAMVEQTTCFMVNRQQHQWEGSWGPDYSKKGHVSMITQTHPEVCFANPFGGSQTKEVYRSA